MITTRLMLKKDIDRVHEIEVKSFRSPWSRMSLLGELKNNVAKYVLAENEDAVVTAYGGMWILFEEAHVTNIAVHPDFRGQGIGKLLLLSMMREAVASGASEMTLEVRESNTVAQNLYFGLSFTRQGFRKGYYTDTGEGALLLWNREIEKTIADNACFFEQIKVK